MVSILVLSLLSQMEIKDEGVTQGRAIKINCSGAGITCSVSGATATFSVDGGGGGGSSFDYVSFDAGTINVNTLNAGLIIPSAFIIPSDAGTCGSGNVGQLIQERIDGGLTAFCTCTDWKPSAGVLLAVDFDSSSAADKSGHATCTLIKDAGSSAGGVEGTAGSFLNTYNSGLDCGDAGIPFDSNNWTLAAWINKPVVAVLSERPISYFFDGPTMYFGNGGGMAVAKSSVVTYTYPNPTLANKMSYLAADLNTWVHFVITRTGTVLRGYRNGIMVDETLTHTTAYSTTTAGGATGVSIGRSMGGGGSNIEGSIGMIDDVFIFGRAISSAEVQMLYNRGAARGWTAGYIYGWQNLVTGYVGSDSICHLP